MRIGTVVNWADAIIDRCDDGAAVLWVQVETLVPDAILMRLFDEALAMLAGGWVSVVGGFVVARMPAEVLEDEPTLRAVFDEYAFSAEYEHRVSIGLADDGR